MTTTEVFVSGDGQAVRLPHGYEFDSKQVAIRRDGSAVILEPMPSNGWPPGFFEDIHIHDASFDRPDQGAMPQLPPFDAK